MIFKDLPALTQVIVIRDLIKFTLECRQKELTVLQAFSELSNDDILTYDIKDGSINL